MGNNGRKSNKILILLFILIPTLVLGSLGGLLYAGYEYGFGIFNSLYKANNVEGNSDAYSSESINMMDSTPLRNKTILCLGSSVTNGACSKGEALPEYINKRFGATIIKDAVDGTTLVDNGNNSYYSRLKNHKKGSYIDLLFIQLSTNDATKQLPLGDLNSYDTSTITGSINSIVKYANEELNCPTIFYTNSYYENEYYSKMVDRVNEIEGIGVLDLYNNSKLNNISNEELSLYMFDKIHPTKAGYLKWWGPAIERPLAEQFYNLANPDNVYKENESWAYAEIDEDCEVDTFFLCPSSDIGGPDRMYLDYSDPDAMAKFKGGVTQEKGIFDTDTRFFAPYYHQGLIYTFTLELEVHKEFLDRAYEDVKNAFEYYLYNINQGNKIILAGFSQGSDLIKRVLLDFKDNDIFYDNFVCCYVLGSAVDDYYISSNRINMCKGEDDIKCVININCEAVNCDSSFVLGKGQHTYCINPLTWTYSSEVADKSLNKGAKFFDQYDNLVRQEDNFCGCYIDPERGTIKVVDLENEWMYNPINNHDIAIFGDGCYHLFDFIFFYENLKENVSVRVRSALNNNG